LDLGRTSRGTPVRVNRQFAACDLRLGVGALVPIGNNVTSGPGNFGGGGKLVMPGVCGIDTVAHQHKSVPDKNETGPMEDNVPVWRLDIEEAAHLAGLHFKVDVVVNNCREVVGLFAGDLVSEHRAGAKRPRKCTIPTGSKTGGSALAFCVQNHKFQIPNKK
jgi:nickel-dependent lactate racemase